MAINPPAVRYGQANIQASSAGNATIVHASVGGQGGSGLTYPNSHLDATTVGITVTFSNTLLGVGAIWAVALVEDGADPAGDFTNAGQTALSAGVLAYRELNATAGASPASVTLGDSSGPVAALNPAIQKGGTFRLILIQADSIANARRKSNVNTGATTNYHQETDRNDAAGSLNTVASSGQETGVCGRRVVITAFTPTAGNWRYHQSNQVAVSIRPSGATSAAIVNPKNLKLALAFNSDGTSQVGVGASPNQSKVFRAAPNTTGDATFTGILIDTEFGTQIGGTPYYGFVGVNDVFGDSSTLTTPTDERAQIYTVGTQAGTTTSQRSPYVFSATGHASGLTDVDTKKVRTSTASITASAAFLITTDSAFLNIGISSFGDSGRTQAQNIFRRAQATATDNAIPYLQAYLSDAYGVALASLTNAFSATIKTANATPQTENSQTISTDANGRIQWNYTIAASHAAFNRYLKTGAARVAGSHVTTGPDSASSPPATFSTPNGGAYSAPFPAYPKTVLLAGTGFSSGNEPSYQTINVFGVNSEVVLEDIFTCDAGQDTVNANNEPTGVANRSKAKATGALRFKDSSDVNESTGKIATVGEFHPKDVAGRNMNVTAAGDHLSGRFAIWNSTGGIRTTAPTSESNDNYSLQGALGYGPGTGGDNGFQSMSDPADPGLYAIYFSRADTTAQRDTFDLNSAAPETAGFTGDAGNFGYVRVLVSFVAIDATLRASLVADKMLYFAGDPHRFNLSSGKYLPDSSELEVKTDAPPTIYIRRDGGAGVVQTATLSFGTMTAIAPDGNGKSANWEYSHSGLPNGTYKVFVTYFVSGSRPPGGGEFNIFVGVPNPDLRVVVLGGSEDFTGHHMVAGEDFLFGIAVKNMMTHKMVVPDANSSKVSILRKAPTGSADDGYGQYFDSDFTWKRFTSTATAYAWPLTQAVAGSNVFTYTFTGAQTAAWGSQNVIVIGHCLIGGISYHSVSDTELVDLKFRHDATNETSIPFDSVNGHHHTGADGSRAIGDRS